MANNENLKPFKTVEEAREAGRKGGIASQKVQHEKRALADVVRRVLMESVAPDSEKTKLDAIVEKTLYRLKDNPSVKDLETLQRILGESVLKVDMMTDEERQQAIKDEMAKLYGKD